MRVVSPRNFFLFTPLLPSTATGTLPSASVCSPVRELISYKAAPLWRRIYYVWRGELPSETRFYPATCTDVDFAQKVVRCVGDDGEFGMHFDKLVVAIGGTTNTFGTKGVEENCLFMKEIGDGVLSELKRGGMTCKEVKAAGYLCSVAKEAGYGCHEAEQAGWSGTEGVQAGYGCISYYGKVRRRPPLRCRAPSPASPALTPRHSSRVCRQLKWHWDSHNCIR